MTLSEELDELVKRVAHIPDQKNYWMIRTKSGQLYESFIENDIVTLEHTEVSLSQLYDIRKQFGDDIIKSQSAIRHIVRDVHTSKLDLEEDEELNTRRASLIASQIFKFVYEIKKGDLIVIPSYNSDLVTFGVVTENNIANISPELRRKTGTDAILGRIIKWTKDLRRIDLDPYLYKMFTAHHALVNVGAYAEVIERSLNDLFVLDEEAHLVINVQKEGKIPAKDLFGLGKEILDMVDEFAKLHGLEDVSSEHIDVNINVNSPGKIDLKSIFKRTTVVTGIILAIVGGGYEDSSGHKFKTDGLINAIDKFITHRQEGGLKEKIWEQYKDSLDVKDPEDMIELLKQVSDNKDLSK